MRLFTKLMRLFRAPLSCKDADSFLALYLDGALETATERKFETHLKHCPNCSTFLEQYRTTIDLCRSSRIDDLPPELVSETLDFLRKHV